MSALEIRGLSFSYGRQSILAGVDLDVPDGGSTGLVGESGSGKSTIARIVAGLLRPTAGTVRLDGTDIGYLPRRSVQMVFQDPYASLNPRMSVGDSIREVLKVHKRPGTVEQVLDLVHLPARTAGRRPADLSGGMRQRVALARALAAGPDLLVADEITSALDASVQGAVLNLLREIRGELNLSMLFISHNLAVVRYVSDIVTVLDHGKVVETGPAEALVRAPQHPYTRALIDAVPRLWSPS